MSFLFNSRSSDEFGLVVQQVHDVLMPAKRVTELVIPGRQGAYRPPGKPLFQKRTISIDCTWAADRWEESADAVREIAYWLSVPGTLRLERDWSRYYSGQMISEIPLSETIPIERFTLVFSCEPFAYHAATTQPLKNGSNALHYEGTAETPCLVQLVNPNWYEVRNITITVVKKRR